MASAPLSRKSETEAFHRGGAAPQPQFPALDQVNVRVWRALAGKGQVPVVITAAGVRSNAVTVSIRERQSRRGPADAEPG